MEHHESAQLYTALHRLGRQLYRCAHHIVPMDGFYREQSRLLFLIEENEGIIQRDLAERMDVRPSSMTAMLRKMEQLGLVLREQDEKDQRVMHIFLTEKGKAAAEKSGEVNTELTNVLFRGLTENEVKELLRLVEKLTDSLSAMDSAALSQAFSRGHHHGFDFDKSYHHRFHRF